MCDLGCVGGERGSGDDDAPVCGVQADMWVWYFGFGSLAGYQGVGALSRWAGGVPEYEDPFECGGRRVFV